MSDVLLRPLKPEDCELLFSWRNDPWIVSLSASQKKVALEEHLEWFTSIIDSSNNLVQVICDQHSNDMGFVRIVRNVENRGVLTVYLMHRYIGKGRGGKAISLACQKSFNLWGKLEWIDAWIRKDNLRSINAFSKVGFQYAENINLDINDEKLICMTLKRDVNNYQI